MNEMTTLFNTFVFPKALCILLIWFLYKKVWPRIETTLDLSLIHICGIAGTREQTKISFSTLLGGKDIADGFLKDITNFAAKDVYKRQTQHAIGVVSWFEFDSKVTDNQRVAVLEMAS